MRSASRFQSYIDKHTKKRYRLRKYIIFIIFLVILGVLGGVSQYTDRLDKYLDNISTTSRIKVSDWVARYKSVAFVDKNLFSDYSGVFPDVDELAHQEMAWLSRIWIFWAGGIGLGLPLILFFLFQVVKRIIDRIRPPPLLDEKNLSIYREICRQTSRAYWRANSHNLEKSLFLILLLGFFLFVIQFLLQPFVMLSHEVLISVLVSFMAYTALVYFFYLFLQRFPYSRVIRIIDREMDLRQSLPTALEVEKDYRSSPLYLYLLRETKEKLCKDNILRFFPRKFPRLTYRNVGTTTFLMGVTIFFVSLALPVMALVYNNLRSGLLFPPKEKATTKKVENIILEESSKIRLLKDFLQNEKNSPKLASAAKELSNLSKRLDNIVMKEKNTRKTKSLSVTVEEKLNKNWVAMGAMGDKDEEVVQWEAKSIQKEKIIAGESPDLHLAFQLDFLIKDLIRYDAENKTRKASLSTESDKEKNLSSSNTTAAPHTINKLQPHGRIRDSSIISVNNKITSDRAREETKKLRQLTAMVANIQKKLDRFQQYISDDNLQVKATTSKENDLRKFEQDLSELPPPEMMKDEDIVLIEAGEEETAMESDQHQEDQIGYQFLENDRQDVNQEDQPNQQPAEDKQKDRLDSDHEKSEEFPVSGGEADQKESEEFPESGNDSSDVKSEELAESGDRAGVDLYSENLSATSSSDKESPPEILQKNSPVREQSQKEDSSPKKKLKEQVSPEIKSKKVLGKKDQGPIEKEEMVAFHKRSAQLSGLGKGYSRIPQSVNWSSPSPSGQLSIEDQHPLLIPSQYQDQRTQPRKNREKIEVTLQNQLDGKDLSSNSDDKRKQDLSRNKPGKLSGLQKQSWKGLQPESPSSSLTGKVFSTKKMQKKSASLVQAQSPRNLQQGQNMVDIELEDNPNRDKSNEDNTANDDFDKVEIIQPTSITFYRDELVREVDTCIHFGETIRYKEGIRKNLLQLEQFRNKIVTVSNPLDIKGMQQDYFTPIANVKDPRKIQSKPEFSDKREILNQKEIGGLSSELRGISANLNNSVARLEKRAQSNRMLFDFQSGFAEEDSSLSQFKGSSLSLKAYKGNFPGRDTGNSSLTPDKLPFFRSGNKSPKAIGDLNITGGKPKGVSASSFTPEIGDGQIEKVIEDLKNLSVGVRRKNLSILPQASGAFSGKLPLTSSDMLDLVEGLQEEINQEDDFNNIKDLANDLSRITHHIGNRGLGKSLVPPEKPKLASLKNPSNATLVEEINKMQEQIYLEHNPGRLQDLSGKLAQKIGELSNHGLTQNSPEEEVGSYLSQQQRISLEKQVLELASKMRTEQNPSNLKNISAEFVQLVEAYSQTIRSARVPPESLPSGISSQSQSQSNTRIRKLAAQMRQESNLKNLQVLANQISLDIQDLGKQNRLSDNLPKRIQESFEEVKTPFNHLTKSADDLQKNLSSRKTNRTTGVPWSRQNPGIMLSRNLRQLDHINQEIQELANQMQKTTSRKNLKNLKDNIIHQTREFMALSLGRETQMGSLGPGVSEQKNQIGISIEQLRQEQREKRTRTMTEKRTIRGIQGPDSGKGIPPESGPSTTAGESISTLHWQMEYLSEQLQTNKDSEQIKKLSQEMLHTVSQFQHQIAGTIPSGPTGLAGINNLEIFQTGKNIREITRQIQTSSQLQKPNNLFNLLSQFTKDFSSQILGKGNDPSKQLDSKKNTELKDMSRSLNRLVNQIRHEKDPNLIRQLTERINQLTRQMQKSYLARENIPFELQMAAFPNRQGVNQFPNREILSDRKREEQETRQQNKQMTSPASQLRGQTEKRDTEKAGRRIPQNTQQVAALNHHADQLYRNLRQETDPSRLRELSKDISRLADQVRKSEQGSKSNKLQSSSIDSLQPSIQDNIENRISGFSPQQMRQLALFEQNITDLSRDIANLATKDNRLDVGNKLKQQIKQIKDLKQNMILADPEPQKALAFAAAQLQHISDQMKAPKQPSLSKEKASKLAGLSRKIRDQIRSLKNGQIPADFKAEDNLFSDIRNLSEQMRSPKTPSELQNLRDLLAEDLSRLKEQFLNKERPERMDQVSRIPTKIPDSITHIPTGGGIHDTKLDRLTTEMDRLTQQILSEADSKRLQELGKKLAGLGRGLLDQEKLNDSSLKVLSSQRKQKKPLDIEDLATNKRRTKDSGSRISHTDKGTKLTRRKEEKKLEQLKDSKRESLVHDQTFDPTRKALTDIGLQIQKVSEKIQKENDPGKVRKDKKQLVQLSQQITGLLQKNTPNNLAQQTNSILTRANKKDLAKQLKVLSRRLKKMDEDQQLSQISDRLNRLALRIHPGKRKLSSAKNKSRSTKSKGKDIKSDRKEKNNPQRKTASAIKLIDKTIRKLKTFGNLKKPSKKKQTKPPKGGTRMSMNGRKNQQLMIANRFEAQEIAKDTNVIPETGEIRNVLSMERNIYQDEVLKRIIRRLEMNKRRIEQINNVAEAENVLLKDYSDIPITRTTSRQPNGLEGIRYSEKDRVVMSPSKKDNEKEEFKTQTVSSMSTEQRFLNIQMKIDSLKNRDMIPTQRIQVKKDKSIRLSPFQEAADSVDEDNIPPKYQNILKRLFSDNEKTDKEAGF